jgi:hypothetical protein
MGTGLIMTAVAVAVGGFALEAVMRMLRRAIQPVPAGLQTNKTRALPFSYSQEPIKSDNRSPEKTMAPALPNLQSVTPNADGHSQQRARDRRYGKFSAISPQTNAKLKTRRAQSSLRQVPLGPAFKWIGGELMTPHSVQVVRTKIR